MELVKIENLDNVFSMQGSFINGMAVGTISDDSILYLINKDKMEAYKLPDKYQKTQFYLIPNVGGYSEENLIMINTMSKLELKYHHDHDCASGLWGWIDLDGNEIIKPKYIFALNFIDGIAFAAKGDWEQEDNKYWAYNERWGIIDSHENIIVPFEYDDGINLLSENLVAVKNGHTENREWVDGTWKIYDIKKSKEILEIDGFIGYSEIEYNYIKVDSEDFEYTYIYDLETNNYLFKEDKYSDIEIIGRDKFIFTKKE